MFGQYYNKFATFLSKNINYYYSLTFALPRSKSPLSCDAHLYHPVKTNNAKVPQKINWEAIDKNDTLLKKFKKINWEAIDKNSNKPQG